MHLFLVRHGQSLWNELGLVQGQADIALSPIGYCQAEALAKRLEHEPLQAVYSSDLQRAQKTAELLASCHSLPVALEPKLRELAFGHWEGLTFSEVQGRYPLEWQRWCSDPVSYAPEGGETYGQVAERVGSVVQGILQQYHGQSVAIVAHERSLQSLICATLGVGIQSYWRFGLVPASLSELLFSSRGAILIRLNDTCHLQLDACTSRSCRGALSQK